MTEPMPPAAEWKSLASLRAWDRNPRRNRDAFLPVARSMLAFGFGAPLLARPDGTLVAGHTRRVAAHVAAQCIDEVERALAAVYGPAVAHSGGPAAFLVPVRVGAWSDEEAKALAIADNRLGEIASWDSEELMRLVLELPPGFAEAAGVEVPTNREGSEETQPVLGGITYRVLITCTDETHQAALMERFDQEGLPCQPLIS